VPHSGTVPIDFPRRRIGDIQGRAARLQSIRRLHKCGLPQQGGIIQSEHRFNLTPALQDQIMNDIIGPEQVPDQVP
jgi:hypothetical protein